MKIAIFGGTFNPPHNEHINMCNHLIKSGFDKVYVMPSNNPPHKSCDISFDMRCDMVELAITGQKGLELCPIEGLNNAINYSYATIKKLKKIYGDISFVIGGDSLIDLHQWKEPYSIINDCTLVVFGRAGQNQDFKKAYDFWVGHGADIMLLDYVPKDVSSSIIRYNAECGYYYDIDTNVAEYIKDNGLYKQHSNIINKLKQNIPLSTFEHSMRTYKWAININNKSKLGVNNDEIFLASMLHDCAKHLNNYQEYKDIIPQDSLNTAVEHQFVGSVLAQKEYGITNQNILDAIKTHTTAQPNMNTLQKIIYCADMLEDNRDFDGIAQLREVVAQDFYQGFKQCLYATYNHLEKNNKKIYNLTLEAVRYYKEKQ